MIGEHKSRGMTKGSWIRLTLFLVLVGWLISCTPYTVGPSGVDRVASPGMERQLRYHGVLAAHWDYKLETWVFIRDGKKVKLKTRVVGKVDPARKGKVR